MAGQSVAHRILTDDTEAAATTEWLAELASQRTELLPFLVVAQLLLYWLWYLLMAPDALRAGLVGNWLSRLDAGAVLLIGGSAFSLWLFGRRACLAVWLWVAISVLVRLLIMDRLPPILSQLLGMVAVVATHALLGSPRDLPAVLATWSTDLAAQALGWAPARAPAELVGLLASYGAVWVLLWLSDRPIETATHWAVQGWLRSRSVLEETQQRRGELYRVVRALEEATYRIERMNNELLLARQTSDLARLNKARFVATVSHELRGPLNLILGFSRLMALSPERYGSPLPPSYRADIDTIYTNSRHLVALLDDILDLSQIEAEHLPLIRERVDLGRDVIEYTVLAVRPLIERKGLTLNIDLDDNMPLLLGDRLRLRQVLINLLTNAVRYTEHGGITVRSQVHPDGALVTVEDTGRGIAPDQLPKLFQEFQQLSLENGQRQGTGLGLAISKHLVQMHAGRIWAESTEGQGTRFHFLIPLPGDMSSTWSTARASERQLVAGRSECCLVLHDDARAIRMIARHLDGFRVVALPRAADLASLVEELFPRAVISTPNGAQEAWEALQGLPYDVPIVACQLPEYGQHHSLPNVASYLIKPISPDVVQATLRHAGLVEGECTVLLVDDDPDAVRLLEAILTNLPRPYRILRAYDGEQALAIMAKQTPDLVFADQVMPGIDGLQMVDLMYQDTRLCKVPVVVISAHDPEEEPPAFRTPFSIRCKAPIPMAAGIGALRELLAVFRPSYLGASGSLEPSAAVDRAQSAS